MKVNLSLSLKCDDICTYRCPEAVLMFHAVQTWHFTLHSGKLMWQLQLLDFICESNIYLPNGIVSYIKMLQRYYSQWYCTSAESCRSVHQIIFNQDDNGCYKGCLLLRWPAALTQPEAFKHLWKYYNRCVKIIRIERYCILSVWTHTCTKIVRISKEALRHNILSSLSA